MSTERLPYSTSRVLDSSSRGGPEPLPINGDKSLRGHMARGGAERAEAPTVDCYRSLHHSSTRQLRSSSEPLSGQLSASSKKEGRYG